MNTINSHFRSASVLRNPPQYAVCFVIGVRYFVLSGKGIYGFFTALQGRGGRAVLIKISTPPLSGSIFLKNLATPKPYTIIAPETKTTDPIEKTHKKNVGFCKEAKRMETSTPSPPKIRINFKNYRR